MRVGLLSPLFESVPPKLYGGTERVVHNLARGLTQNGVDVTVFASGDSHVPGILVPVVEESLRLHPERYPDPCAYNIKMLGDIAKQADDFDVLHNHHDYWMLPLSEMTRTPLLTTLHGRLDLQETRNTFMAFPNSYYTSISDSQRTPLRDLHWLRTIYHGIDLKNFRYHERPGDYLAFLGRITVEKRPELAIEIAKKSGVPLKIAAKIEGPASQAYYDTYVKPHVDGKFIQYVGEISESEKCDFLGQALAMVFPIDWPEPFGLVMIESLACGTPVLARPLGAAAEILGEGITGYSSLDVQTLARKVGEIGKISRPACRRWVEEKFSLQRMTEDYIHVYQHLIQLARFRARTSAGQRPHRHRWDFVHSLQRTANGDS